MAIGNWALRFANRHGWLSEKKFNKYYEMVNTQVMEFAGAFRSACGNVGEMLATEVVTLLQLGCMYALPFFVLRAFGEPADLIVCLASGSMLELLINAIPLPGGTGGAEVGFAYLFRDMFGQHLAAGFVIWRAVEYLLPVLIAAPCMGMRSNGGVSIRRRWDALWGGFTGRINGFVETGSLRGTGKRRAAGSVTVKPKARKAAAKPQTRRAPISGTGSAKVDVAAKIAAGKAAAKKK